MLSLLAGAAAARTPQLSRVDKALNAVLAEVESFERSIVSPEDYQRYFEDYNVMSLAESDKGCVAAVTDVGAGPVVDFTAGAGTSCGQTEELKEMYSKLYIQEDNEYPHSLSDPIRMRSQN